MSKIKIFGLGGLNENGKNMYIVEVDDNIFVFPAAGIEIEFSDNKLQLKQGGMKYDFTKE